MTSGGEGWWIASDGRWYPPEQHPSRNAPAPPPAGSVQPQRLGGIGTAAMVLLLATAGLDVLIAILGFVLSSTAGRYARSGSYSSLDDWVSAEDAYFGVVGLAFLVWIATFVLLIIWLVKAHTASSSLLPNPSDRKYSRGWSIGVWFIPLANLVSTPMVFAETQRIAYADRVNGRASPGWRSERLDPKLVWWWVLFIGGILVSRFAESTVTIDGPIDEYQTAVTISSVGNLVSAAGAVTGALFLRAVSGRLNVHMHVTPTAPPAPHSPTRPTEMSPTSAGWAPPVGNDGRDRPDTPRPVIATSRQPQGTRDRPRPSLPVRSRDQKNPNEGGPR